MTTPVSRHQNVPILDFTGAKDDGGSADNWSYKMYKAPVKSSPLKYQHPTFYRPDAQPIVSQQRREKLSHLRFLTMGFFHPYLDY